MMVGNSHSHAYERKYQGKIIDCMHQNRPFITTCILMNFVCISTLDQMNLFVVTN